VRRYAIPLLAGGVRKAGRVAIAMDARAFGALPSRTYRRRMTVGRRDAIFLCAVVFVTALVIAGLYVIGVARFALW
jgi:energy-coupling factor transport system permease protein